MSLIYSSGLDKIVDGNSSFDRGILRVCYTGRNRNKSSISKEAFESCIKSIYNVPIVCRYDRDADEIGAHDIELVKDKDGGLSIVNMTQPVGVVPESAQYYWEDIEEEDGTIHEYLCIDVLLWKRQEAYRKIKEDGITDESMEINVLQGHMEDGFYVIERFEFTAFCLLGTAEPCYESAALLTFSEGAFREQYHAMMKELKETYQLAAPSAAGTDTDNHSEGGNETLDQEKMELLSKYGLTAEQLEFDANALSCEELESKLATMFADNGDNSASADEGSAAEADAAADNGDGGAAPTSESDDGEQAFALAGQLMESICEALSVEKTETCWGEESRYWYVDHDDEKGEVYAYDIKDWNLYGFAYAKNGDNVIVDFASKKRMKFTIVEFDEGDQAGAVGAMFAKVCEKYEANDKAWSEKFEKGEAELKELREFKKNTEDSAATAAFDRSCDELFAQFADLDGVEGFAALRESRASYTLEELEEKCYALRGRAQTGKFALQSAAAQKAPKLPVERHDVKDESNADPYGGVFQQYGISE